MMALVNFDINAEERSNTTDVFDMVHERMLGALILECSNRRIEIESMERNEAVEKIITVFLKERITNRRANSLMKKVVKAVKRSENFLNLTSTSYHERP